MPGNEEVSLVRRIVEAYGAIGVPAKSYRGKVFICREEGWDGPLDPRQLEATYIEDIKRIEEAVRAATLKRFPYKDEELSLKLFWALDMTAEAFETQGFSVHKANLYAKVAHHLARWRS